VPDRTGEIVRGGFRFREHFRVEAIGPVGGAAREDQSPHHARVLHGQLQGHGAAQAVTDKIGSPDAERVQEYRGVGRHLLVGQRPVDVSGVAVALQFDRDDLARRREGGQEVRKAAVDRSHGAVKESQRGPVAVDLVVHVEPVHRHVTARGARPVGGVRCWHGYAPFSAAKVHASLTPDRGTPRDRHRQPSRRYDDRHTGGGPDGAVADATPVTSIPPRRDRRAVLAT
jgi:hypothetical protein